jgi:hypothetical protein
MATAAMARTTAASEPITLTRRYYNELQSRLAAAEARHPRTAAAVRRGAEAVKEDKYGITSIGIGALAMFATTLDVIKKNKYIKKYWWLLPAIVIGIGWFLRRKQDKASARYRYGSALLVTGGGLLVKAWRERPKKKDEDDEDDDKDDDKDKKDPAADTKGFEGSSSFGTSAGRLVLNPATGEYTFEPTTAANGVGRPDPAQRMAERLYNTAA